MSPALYQQAIKSKHNKIMMLKFVSQLDTRPASLTVIITKTHIFHVSQKS